MRNERSNNNNLSLKNRNNARSYHKIEFNADINPGIFRVISEFINNQNFDSHHYSDNEINNQNYIINMKLLHVVVILKRKEGNIKVNAIFYMNNKDLFYSRDLKPEIEEKGLIERIKSNNVYLMTKVSIVLSLIYSYTWNLAFSNEKLTLDKIYFALLKIESIDFTLFSKLKNEENGNLIIELNCELQSIIDNVKKFKEKVSERTQYQDNKDSYTVSLTFNLFLPPNDNKIKIYFMEGKDTTFKKENIERIQKSMNSFLYEMIITKEYLDEEILVVKDAIELFLMEEYNEEISFDLFEGDKYNLQNLMNDNYSTKDLEDSEMGASEVIEEEGQYTKSVINKNVKTVKKNLIFRKIPNFK